VKAELPSGEWAGHYAQAAQRFPQRMTLEFADGIVRGDGIDGIGGFRLEGEYRAVDGAVRVGWIKTYDGAHSILYVGVLEADGSIAGEWRIPPWSRDAFALWPMRDQT
jgi:hypothetical protein